MKLARRNTANERLASRRKLVDGSKRIGSGGMKLPGSMNYRKGSGKKAKR